MPPNTRIIDEGAVIDDGGSFTEETVDIRDAVELDVALLPAVPAVNDAFYVGCDNPCRILTFDIGQEGIGEWDIEWEYWNGTAFTGVTNQDDRTNDFRLAGRRTVSWDMPTDMASTTVTGSSVNAYWTRGVVTQVTGSGTQQAVGNQGWYENGQYWMWFDTLAINQQTKYEMSIGGADLISRHAVFPGTAGVLTPDDSTMELEGDFAIHFDGAISFAVTGSATQCLICKGQVLRLTVTDTGEVTLAVSDSATTLTVSGIPEATTGVSGDAHTIDILSDGTDLTLTVDGVGTVSGTAQILLDTTDSWEFVTNNSATFFHSIYMLPDDNLGGQIRTYDTESQLDSGAVFVDTVSTTGQPIVFHGETYETKIGLAVTAACFDAVVFEGDSNTYPCKDIENSGFTTLLAVGNYDATRLQTNFFFVTDDVLVVSDNDNVTSVVFEIVARETDACTTVSARIQAWDEDDATDSVPTTEAAAEAKVLTTAFVDWTLPIITAGVTYTSPNIVTVLNEVWGRPGWASGNAIGLYVQDNGSTANCAYEFAPVEDEDGNSPRFRLVRSTDPPAASAPTNDFVELDQPVPFPDWTGSSDYSSQLGGAYQGERTAVNAEDDIVRTILQNLTASSGEVWSASAYGTCAQNPNECKISFDWLDSGLSVISSTTTSTCGNALGEWCYVTHNNFTAPALTAFIQVRFTTGGQFGIPNQTLDAVMACVCASAPQFPNALNRLQNPSFEEIYDTTGTWVGGIITTTVTDVTETVINWDEYTYPQATTNTVVMETSIDNQVSWQTATNGGSIALINEGDDLTGGALYLRATLTGDQTFSPVVSFASAFIGGDPSLTASTVFYELRSTPGVLLTDLSTKGNDGTMSYPVHPSGIVSSMTALDSTRLTLFQSEAVGVPDAASAVTGAQTDLNLFGEDPGAFLPLGDLFAAAAADGGLPVRFIWILLIMILGIMIGAFALKVFGSVLMASVILGFVLVLAAWIGDGLIPGWTVVVGLILLTALNLLRPRLPI